MLFKCDISHIFKDRGLQLTHQYSTIYAILNDASRIFLSLLDFEIQGGIRK